MQTNCFGEIHPGNDIFIWNKFVTSLCSVCIIWNHLLFREPKGIATGKRVGSARLLWKSLGNYVDKVALKNVAMQFKIVSIYHQKDLNLSVVEEYTEFMFRLCAIPFWFQTVTNCLGRYSKGKKHAGWKVRFGLWIYKLCCMNTKAVLWMSHHHTWMWSFLLWGNVLPPCDCCHNMWTAPCLKDAEIQSTISSLDWKQKKSSLLSSELTFRRQNLD